MKISEVEREITDLVTKYSGHGVDVILKAIAIASINDPIITKEYVQVLVTGAFRDIKGGDAYECPQHN